MEDKIPWARPLFFGKEKEYLVDALDSTWISGGYYVEKFEEEFTRCMGFRYGVTASNGTTALQLAIKALGIGPGDEVVVPGFTFVAPVNMIIDAGATPVYADIDPLTWCLDPASVEKGITPKTKAIIPVHVYGNVCDMDALKLLAERHQLFIVEDVAEAAFSKYKGQYAGTFGKAGCFSFQATKTITMGEGGFVLTDDREVYEAMRIIRDHGMRKGRRYWHEVVGYNFRLTNLQAAVGCGQLENVDVIISERKRVFQLYRQRLDGEEGITLQHFAPDVEPVVWAIAVKLDPRAYPQGRDTIMNQLEKAGIETRPGFYAVSLMNLYACPKLSVCEDISHHVISLPTSPTLRDEQIEFICNKLKSLSR